MAACATRARPPPASISQRASSSAGTTAGALVSVSMVLPFFLLKRTPPTDAHAHVDDSETIAIRDDGIEVQFAKPGGGAEPLRQAGDQSGKPSYVDWRTAPKSGKNLLALQLIQHGPRFLSFDWRQAQGHVVQDFRPYAAKAGHHHRSKERVASSPEDQFGTRSCLPLQKSRAGA